MAAEVAPNKNDGTSDVRIELMTTPEDFAAGYEVLCESFGRQINDAIW